MPRSMTGFGESMVKVPFGTLSIEIQSVNRKHLEIAVYLPKELSRFETMIRKWISAQVGRGFIQFRMHLTYSEEAANYLFPDVSLLRLFKQGWEKICHELNLDLGQLSLSFLLESLPVSARKDLLTEEDLPLLQSAVQNALLSLTEMKKMEGETLVADLQRRFDRIQELSTQIEAPSQGAQDRLREKLQKKLEELVGPSHEMDERVLREIALFAEKADISEELIRLNSHFVQFKTCLTLPSPIGRKMEFVLQEILREVNTIGSKSSEASISVQIIEIKAELERIREQLQNIE